MNEKVLKERIQERLRTLVLARGVVAREVDVTTDGDGNPSVEVTDTTGDVKMDEDTSRVIAQAVATAVAEFLTKEVVVKVTNAAIGGATLSGYLE